MLGSGVNFKICFLGGAHAIFRLSGKKQCAQDTRPDASPDQVSRNAAFALTGCIIVLLLPCLSLTASSSSWLLVACGSSWLLLAPPGSYWLLLAPPGPTWLLLASPCSSCSFVLGHPGHPGPRGPWEPWTQDPGGPRGPNRVGGPLGY